MEGILKDGIDYLNGLIEPRGMEQLLSLLSSFTWSINSNKVCAFVEQKWMLNIQNGVSLTKWSEFNPSPFLPLVCAD